MSLKLLSFFRTELKEMLIGQLIIMKVGKEKIISPI